ncbi:MAG TPA: DUF885 family protein, partial [Myxococcales bacterium]|nr:DUF885 family protein [Myxococcales bacterium]
QFNHDLLLRQLEEEQQGVRFKDWEMPVTQFGGIHIDSPQFITVLSFETVKDYDDFISRMHQLPKAFDQTIDLMRKGMKDGLMPPKILLEQVVSQADKLASQKPEESPFFQPANKMPASFSDADKKRLHDALLAAVRDEVLPEYKKFTAFVRDEYAPKGRAEPGLWALPDGAARYAYAVEQATTTKMTPEEIHQIGLREVAKDRAAMLEIAKKMGFKDCKSFEASIAKNPALHPKSREEILENYRKYVDAMWKKLPQYFGTLPKANVEVMPVEQFREKEASGAQYEGGTPDGKRPGHIKVNTGDYQNRTTLDQETTAYHEGVPGHHLQITIAQETKDLPPFRQHGFYIAYIEGWALYSEQFGVDAGFFQDPYNMYGHLQDDLLRAIRLVADTGYHYKKWSRQQVVDYFHDNSGIDEVEVQSETDRYMAWPAQALGYKVGQLALLSMREKAKRELGPRFDIRAFHDEVLTAGALPLDVLSSRVDGWIARTKAGGSSSGSK